MQDATDLVAKLCAYHSTAQRDPSQREKAQYGLDLVQGKVRDCVTEGVLEPAMSKVKIIQVCLLCSACSVMHVFVVVDVFIVVWGGWVVGINTPTHTCPHTHLPTHTPTHTHTYPHAHSLLLKLLSPFCALMTSYN